MENNEKEFGVMGDVVATAKKVGFKSTDWKKFAQSEYIAKRIFKFVNEFDQPHFSTEEEAEDMAVKIVNFTEAINDYFNERGFCICCYDNEGRGELEGKFFLENCDRFGIWLSFRDRERLRTGDCFVPVWEVLFYIIEDFFEVREFKNEKGERMPLISREVGWPISLVITAIRTSTTSDENIVLLVKAFEAKGHKLKVNLNPET